MHVEIQGHGHDVQISRAFAIAEQSSFHSIRAGEQAEFRRGHAGATIVVSVQTDDKRIAVFEIAAHPFNLVGINIGHRDLDRVRQIQNHFPLGRRLPRVHHGLGNLLGIFHFRHAEALRRILEHYFRSLEPVQTVLDHPRPVDGDGFDLVLRLAEYDAALRG